MEISLKREALETYKRLWGYVKPYKLIGFIALMAMIGTALIEMTMVALIEPLMDEALVAKNIEATRWLPIAFIAVFLFSQCFIKLCISYYPFMNEDITNFRKRRI